MRNIFVMIAATTALAAGPALAADTLVKFRGGVAEHPVAGNSPAGAATVVNTVRGVPPGGRLWWISKLNAVVRHDGSIWAKGEGLVLGGGDATGSRGGVRQVVATLFCGSNEGFTSPPADLSVGGNFEIVGKLDAVPPNPCGDETTPPNLLIRNFANGAPGNWFAAGIVDDN